MLKKFTISLIGLAYIIKKMNNPDIESGDQLKYLKSREIASDLCKLKWADIQTKKPIKYIGGDRPEPLLSTRH